MTIETNKGNLKQWEIKVWKT